MELGPNDLQTTTKSSRLRNQAKWRMFCPSVWSIASDPFQNCGRRCTYTHKHLHLKSTLLFSSFHSTHTCSRSCQWSYAKIFRHRKALNRRRLSSCFVHKTRSFNHASGFTVWHDRSLHLFLEAQLKCLQSRQTREMKGQERRHLKIQNMYLTVTKEVPDAMK